MSKTIASGTDKSGRDVKVEHNEHDSFVKAVTLGGIGLSDEYSVKVDGKTVSTAGTKNEAVDKFADRIKK